MIDGSLIADPETGRPFTPEERLAVNLLHDLSYCGHYLKVHKGGRSGKSPMLCMLLGSGGTVPQQELCTYFELKPGSLSEILSKMEDAGLIERTRDEHDCRKLNVHLTELGQAQAEKEVTARAKFHDECFSCLTYEEQEQLLDMLERIHAHWEELDD